MKMFALASAVVAGLLCTASSADAQHRSRSTGIHHGGTVSNSTTHSVPTYNGIVSAAPGFGSPTVGVPTYNGIVSVSPGSSARGVSGYNGIVSVGTFTPLGGTTMILPSNYSQSSFAPTTTPRTYTGSSFGGLYISPSGVIHRR